MENTKIEKIRLRNYQQRYFISEYPVAKKVFKDGKAETLHAFIDHIINLGKEVYEQNKKAEVTP